MVEPEVNFKYPLERGIFIAPATYHDAILKNGSFQVNLLGSPYQGRGNENLAPIENKKTFNQKITLDGLCAMRVKQFPKKKEVRRKSVLALCFDNFLTTSDLADRLAISHTRA